MNRPSGRVLRRANMGVVARSGTTVENAASGAREWLIPRSSLFERLESAGRVVHVSAPAGSGKTFLVRAWIAAEGLGERTAWVSVGREERDPQAFWLSVLDSIRATGPGAGRVRALTAAPDLDSASLVDRLLEDLSSLEEPLWLVIDDLHELQADDASHGIQRLLRTAPPKLRFVLLTRRDLRLGLHRLRVEGELTELRGEDLRFTFTESRALMQAAGVRLSDGALESLVATTEGWAAGLRLVAMSLARHSDPERYAVSFSGRERAVAEYLLAEVLDAQPEDVTRLLLRTSLLERVNGPLADRLTGSSGSDRILAELEAAGAFVVALDPERTWFRYHHLFADLLALELRRRVPEELPGLHTIAADWFSEHGYPVEAIRHAQAAENWGLAARLLADNSFGMYLDGPSAAGRELLSGFPVATVAADAELATLAAADRRASGSLDESERYLRAAAGMSASVAPERQKRFQVALALERLALARTHNDLDAVAEQAERLVTSAGAPEAIELGLGEDLRTRALIDLGIAEIWTGQLAAGEPRLEQGVAEARRVGRPLLELEALAHWALAGLFRSAAIAEHRAREAIELARKHGWEENAQAATAYIVLGNLLLRRARLSEAESWLERAGRVLQDEYSQPAAAEMLYANRALLEFASGRPQNAIDTLGAGERVRRLLVIPRILHARAPALPLLMLIQLGETDRVAQILADMDEEIRTTGEMLVALASLRLAQDDPDAAADALAPLLDGSARVEDPAWEIAALLVQAIAHDTLHDPVAAATALERALDLAEPDGLLIPFLLYPTRELVERHSRSRTTHAALVSEIRALLAGRTPATRPVDVEPLTEPLTESELRVLRYLPTNLPAGEIASQLFVSLNTVRTHMRNLYVKLGVHSRADAVTRARELGVLSPSSVNR